MQHFSYLGCPLIIQVKLPISLFLWAFMEAYLTVPRNPAAPRGGLTSPAALVYCLARPKSNMKICLRVWGVRPTAKFDGLTSRWRKPWRKNINKLAKKWQKVSKSSQIYKTRPTAKFDGLTKTFPENWDNNAPSVGTLLDYLDTMA